MVTSLKGTKKGGPPEEYGKFIVFTKNGANFCKKAGFYKKITKYP